MIQFLLVVSNWLFDHWKNLKCYWNNTVLLLWRQHNRASLLFNTQSYKSINLSTFLTSPFLPDSILSSRGMIVSGSEVPFENSFPGNSWCEKFVNSELICIDSSGCRCMTIKGGLISEDFLFSVTSSIKMNENGCTTTWPFEFSRHLKKIGSQTKYYLLSRVG